jgi:Zn-dependent membrane protease YugP
VLWLYRLFEIPVWIYAVLALTLGRAWICRRRLDRAYAAAARMPSPRGLSGAEAAAEMLRSAGIEGIAVVPGRGPMGTGYDSVAQTLRLPHQVYHGHTLADVAWAAHAVGHALQHAGGDAPQPLALREAIASGVRLAAGTAYLLLVVGLVLDIPRLLAAGTLVLAGAVLAPMLTLSTERDAARRAARVLRMAALIDSAGARLVDPILAASVTAEAGAILPRWREATWHRPEQPPHRPRALPNP